MKFMHETSPVCGATLETCPAKQMLIDAMDHNTAISPFPNQDQALQPQFHNEDEQSLLVGKKIIREANVNCLGDNCWVVNGLVKALFSNN